MSGASLDGKVAVLVGGSGGIGAATARRMAALGARVVVGYHSRQAVAEALVAELPGGPHLPAQVDIADSRSLAALVETVTARFGRADILVTISGFTRPVPHDDLDALDDALFDRLMQVNLRGVFAAVRAFRSLLAASGDGLVVNVSSLAGLNGLGSNIAYGCAKAGVDVMGKSLARVLAPTIRVMTVSPGAVDTAFVPGRGPAFNEKAARSIPLGRVATADDVADGIVACATLLRYATGSVVLLDGGRAL